MSLIHPVIPADLLSRFYEAGSTCIGIETGTWRAASAKVMARIFDEAYTIEFVEAIWEAARLENANLENLTFLLGSSPEVLADLAKKVTAPCLFHLDAHSGMFYTPTSSRPRTAGDPVASGSTQCPLIDEIKAIDTFPAAMDCCILIDDARVFLGPVPGFRDEDWPSFTEIVDTLRANHERWVTVLDDYIIAVPPSHSSIVKNWWLDILRERNGRYPKLIAPKQLNAIQALRAFGAAVKHGRL